MNLERSIVLTSDAVPAVQPVAISRAGDQVAVGNLRAFITVLVVAHHAVLAYHPFAPAPAATLTASPCGGACDLGVTVPMSSALPSL